MLVICLVVTPIQYGSQYQIPFLGTLSSWPTWTEATGLYLWAVVNSMYKLGVPIVLSIWLKEPFI